ncbi:flagellar hook-length control protein FliK [Rubrivivax sp. RP6-9]|uniref:flagellar hook-length control protein FliK n=1 Tax=Rubrivivax sp. RP6-9 TaxID=3415750 RepID=UPI003CC5E515
MLNSSIAALPSLTPAPPAATANPGSAGTAAGEPGAFARQLERAHAGEGTTGDAPSQAAAPSQVQPQSQAAADAATTRMRTDNERLQRQARQDKAEKAGARPPDARAQTAAESGSEKSTAASEAAEAGDAGVADDTSASTPATDAAVLLASLLNRAVPGGAAARGGADAARNAAAADGRRAAADVGAVPAGAAGAAEALDGAGSGLGGNAAALRAGRDGTGPAQPPAGAETPAFTLPAGTALPGMQAAGATHTATQEVAATPAPYAAQIQAPVGSPDFAPGLSAQVSVMLRDGLQEARLQLNPAEMGPITVQIQIDGSTAQVTMTAEQAPTRNALEQAMPSLAGALREEGLTLTGGGVFEQPRQAQGDAAPAPQAGTRGSGRPDGDAAPAAPVPAGAPRGIVDVFA